MTNILLDYPNLDSDYLLPELKKYIKPHHRVVNVAFSHHEDAVRTIEDWDARYSPTGKYYDSIVTPFAQFGIPADQISVINCFTDTPETAAQKIREADLIYLPGGLPDRLMNRIREFDLIDAISNHTGIVMGFSAGAMVQFREYHISPDDDYPDFCYCEGLPILDDFYLEVHYKENSAVQKDAIERVLRERGKNVYATAIASGAIIIHDQRLTFLGDVRTFTP